LFKKKKLITDFIVILQINIMLYELSIHYIHSGILILN